MARFWVLLSMAMILSLTVLVSLTQDHPGALAARAPGAEAAELPPWETGATADSRRAFERRNQRGLAGTAAPRPNNDAAMAALKSIPSPLAALVTQGTDTVDAPLARARMPGVSQRDGGAERSRPSASAGPAAIRVSAYAGRWRRPRLLDPRPGRNGEGSRKFMRGRHPDLSHKTVQRRLVG